MFLIGVCRKPQVLQKHLTKCDTIEKKSNHRTNFNNRTKQTAKILRTVFPSETDFNWFHHLFSTFHFGRNSKCHFMVFIINFKHIYELLLLLFVWINTGQSNTYTHRERERHNTHQIETMEKRKIAQWSKRIELSLTDQKKITYIHIQLCSFVHSLIKSLYLSGEKANCTQIDAQLCLKKLHMHIHPVQKWVRKVTTSMMRCGFVRKYGSNRWQAGLPNKYIHSNFISLCHMLAQLNSTHSYARALACSLFTFHTKADLVVYTV